MTEEQQAPKQMLDIQRIYIKDVSLEAPSVPQIFTQEWKPEVTIDLDMKHSSVEKDLHEVVLAITVTAKMDDKTVFLAEVHQAGIFLLQGFSEEQMDHVFGAYCPTVLFPYAREAISDLVSKASFPQLTLAPINFDALYMQQKAEKKEQ